MYYNFRPCASEATRDAAMERALPLAFSAEDCHLRQRKGSRMTSTNRKASVIGVAVTIFGVMALPSAQSQRLESPSGTADLLAEVRGLRAELNQFATASIRVQLFMGRLQLQEHRIQVLSQQLVD